MRIGDLRIGGRYLHLNGIFIRTIEKIEGEMVYYRDRDILEQCTKKVFVKKCLGFADGPQPPLDAPPKKYLTPKALIGIAASLATLENQQQEIMQLIPPLFKYLDGSVRQMLLADTARNLSSTITLRQNTEMTLVKLKAIYERRPLIIDALQSVSAEIWPLKHVLDEVSRAVKPLFWHFGEREREIAGQLLDRHAASIERLQNDLNTLLSS